MTETATAEATASDSATQPETALAGILGQLAAVDFNALDIKSPNKCRHYKVVGLADDDVKRAFGLFFQMKQEGSAIAQRGLDELSAVIDQAAELPFDELNAFLKADTKRLEDVATTLKLLKYRLAVVRSIAIAEAVRQYPELAGQKFFIENDGSLGYADHRNVDIAALLHNGDIIDELFGDGMRLPPELESMLAGAGRYHRRHTTIMGPFSFSNLFGR